MTPRRIIAGIVPVALLAVTATLTPWGAARAAPRQTTTCAQPTTKVVTELPWPQDRLGLDALGQQYQGWGVTLAVLSSGVSAGHPQLHGRVLDGLSLGDSGPANDDCLGFGTAVSGAAAAAPVSGTPLTGIAPAASVLPVRLPDWVVNPSTGLDDANLAKAAELLAQAITLALEHDPDVIVLPAASLPDTTQLRTAVAAAEEQGCLLLEGAPTTAEGTNAYPAAYPQVLVVEGVSAEGDFAPTALAGDQVDLLAPGMQVPALTPGRGHQLVSSNVVAAGYAAGAAALVLEAVHPRTAADVRRQLLQSTVPSVYGGLPVLDPAAAMTPTGDRTTRQPAGTLGRLLAGRPEPERASLAATTIAATTLAALVLVLFTGAAVHRGRRRDWRPAGSPAPADVPPDHLSLADDPFRPPGQYGAWWLAGRDDDGSAAILPGPILPGPICGGPIPGGPPHPPDRPDAPDQGGHP
jgi:hypothetical protein